MKLIQDVIPASEQDFDTRLEVPAYQRGYAQLRQARNLSTEVMIEELFNRGVSIEDIFGRYYGLEEIANHNRDEVEGYSEEGQHGARAGLTVGDAQLAAPGKVNRWWIG